MSNVQTEEVGDEHVDALFSFGMGYGLRLARGVAYALVATILVSASSYQFAQAQLLIIAIGLLGLFTASARIGQLGLAILMILAAVPKDVLLPLIS